MRTLVGAAEPDDYLGRLYLELTRVGIRGELRDRILLEVADHLEEGDVDDFGDPGHIAQRFADELATSYSRRAAWRGFVALAAAGLGFAAAWLLVPAAGGWTDVTAGRLGALGLVPAVGMLVSSQIAFAAGVLALLRSYRLRRVAAAPAGEIALLLARTRTAVVVGAVAMLSLAAFAATSAGELATWWVAAVVPAATALTLPLVAIARSASEAARLRSSVPGAPGDVFDDLPLAVPRRPWALCFVVAALAGAAALLAGGFDEGPRNAVAESLLVVGCFAALGRRLGLRR